MMDRNKKLPKASKPTNLPILQNLLALPGFLSVGLFALALIAGPSPAFAQNAIDFALKDLQGDTVRLEDFIGKDVILINFWATWCVPCVKELPHFDGFHKKYGERGLTVLTITVDGPETVAKVKPFMERYGYTFPVLLDTESRVIALYNPRVILPYTVLIDRQGRIRHWHQGYSLGDEKTVEEELVALLGEEAAGAEARAEAEAKKMSVALNESLLFRSFSDDASGGGVRLGQKNQIINRLDASLTYKNFLLGARADVEADFSPWESDARLAKRFFEYSGSKWNLRLGDYYYSVGRGLLLSVLKTFEKEGLEYIIDTSIDGGKLSLAAAPFFAEVYGGWIDQGFSEVKDKVYGGILGWRVKEFAELRLNLMGSRLDIYNVSGDRDVSMASVSVDIPDISDKAKIYGEFVLSGKEKYYSGDKVGGHGVYLESAFFLGDFTLLFEFKDYLNLDFAYNRPPMLESEQLAVLANQFAKEAVDTTGITGGVDYYLAERSMLFWGKAAYIQESPMDWQRDIVHVYGGVEKKFQESGWWNVVAGYRSETADSLVYYYTHGGTFHYQFNLSYPLTGRLSMEADIQGKDFRGEHLDYYEWRSFLSLHYSQKWILTVSFDRTTDPQVLFFRDKRNWLGVQLEIKFSQANAIRIFYGAMKGGVKCSGGICKFFPPFEGFRMDAIFRF
jgi:peroxiredoxin